MAYSGRQKAAAAAALIAIAAIGLERLSRLDSAPEPRNVFPERKAGGTAGVAGIADAPLGRAPSARLPQAGSETAVSKPMTLDDFIELLAQTAPPPLVEQVRQEFKNDLQLQRAWNVYKNVAGPKAPAHEFIAFIGRIPEFRRLVAKFQGEPGFKETFAALANRPEASVAVRGAMKNFLAGKPGSGEGSAKAENIAREWRRKAVSGVDLSKYRMAGVGPLATVAKGERLPLATAVTSAGAAGISGAGGAGAGAGASSAAGAAAGGESKAGKGPDSKAGKNAHNVQKLDNQWKVRTIGDDANFADYRKWITKVLLAMKESTRKAVQPLLESGAEDLWGACYITGNFDECKTVCSKVPEAQCENKDRWQACRSGDTRDAVGCVRLCVDSGADKGCDPHRDEWDPLCSAKGVGQGYCLASQAWGPEVCASLSGITRCTQPTGTLDGGSGEGSLTAGPASGDAATCGSEVEMSFPPCQQLVALLQQVRAMQAAAAAELASARGPGAGPAGPGAGPAGPGAGDVGLTDNYSGPDFCPAPGGQETPQSHRWERTLSTVGKWTGMVTPLGPVGGWLGEKAGGWIGRQIDNGTVGKVAKKVLCLGVFC